MKPNVQNASFGIFVILVTAAFIWLLLPFYSAVLWAIILAVLFSPLNKWFIKKLNGRSNLAAAITLLSCICLVVVPCTLIVSSLVQEANSLYERLSSNQFDIASNLEKLHDILPSYILKSLGILDVGNIKKLQTSLTSYLTEGAQIIAASAISIGQGTARFFIGLGIMLYLLFFLFRDGSFIASEIRKASPLSDFHTVYILSRFTTVLKATVKGNVIIAIVQGAIGGLTFWIIGIEAALLWGVVMATLSLLPAIGSFLIWGPVALYLLLMGDYSKGIILIAVGVFVISLLDNLLRPSLVGKDTKLPDYVILISTLGGVAVFGLNGFVIGPLIAVLFIAVWSLLSNEIRN